MYEPHGWVKTPANLHVSIWRYLSFPRFADLLKRGELHFARLDRFTDAFEGVLPPGTIPLEKDRFQHVPRNPGDELTDWKTYLRWTNRFGRCVDFANCWYTNEHESDAMWRLYAAEGIAVRSSFQRLCASFANEPETVRVGKMYYFDFATEQPPTYGNTLAIAYYKRRQYEHERELRAVVIKDTPDFRGERDCPANQPTGVQVAVDLDILIERIVIAPGRPAAFREEVRAVLDRHGLDKLVQPSVLDERPVLL